MIKYNLKCKNKHEFESWFSDSKEFEKLRKKKIIECTFCGTKNVQKSIMSPSIVSKYQKEKNTQSSRYLKKIRRDLLKMRNFIEKNFNYVGDNLPQEVRNIYYDKSKNKNIYGKATFEEAEELREEGIELTTIPWIDNKKEN
ncbi:MAG: hypothetical protein CBD56_02775 [Candidatus Pelagibacter sp. TMED196]|nr:MAG: hypothetical protein CBD56_02775 [Candidatus Pelagibacter sp. TMED196]|tara:strand:+ start:1320 stop:1745 length:426 start_codon:yes stop_codon:yes gene_type:complete